MSPQCGKGVSPPLLWNGKNVASKGRGCGGTPIGEGPSTVEMSIKDKNKIKKVKKNNTEILMFTIYKANFIIF